MALQKVSMWVEILPLREERQLLCQDSHTTADTLGMSRQRVQQHFLLLREVCSTHLMNHPVSLGGANVIVQIDDSLFWHKPKYQRGRAPAADQWVFGIVDTSTTPGACPGSPGSDADSNHSASRAAWLDHSQ